MTYLGPSHFNISLSMATLEGEGARFFIGVLTGELGGEGSELAGESSMITCSQAAADEC